MSTVTIKFSIPSGTFTLLHKRQKITGLSPTAQLRAFAMDAVTRLPEFNAPPAPLAAKAPLAKTPAKPKRIIDQEEIDYMLDLIQEKFPDVVDMYHSLRSTYLPPDPTDADQLRASQRAYDEADIGPTSLKALED